MVKQNFQQPVHYVFSLQFGAKKTHFLLYCLNMLKHVSIVKNLSASNVLIHASNVIFHASNLLNILVMC